MRWSELMKSKILGVQIVHLDVTHTVVMIALIVVSVVEIFHGSAPIFLMVATARNKESLVVTIHIRNAKKKIIVVMIAHISIDAIR
eukprot:CAMPEP_0197290738 /NCGR_PEP_ID=MMETSP0890-20130614/9661_1 /TAXON_ID=44058 ORGANISM="Aureoumbra lagunensis, Strain CCMP1510" /NCGR_SAMPLE_ID=MMETSP0890 /ASSEMBLY_ACC=CAM_ASM_000533 /LENGTH=85 /DNA_ID=CAMNT_0042762979 /DNA_START=58 /DNA_END=315 /DNA_ORIENTATION=+